MYKLSDASITEVPLISLPQYGEHATSARSRAAGVSKQKSRLSRQDLLVLIVELLCFSLATLTVFYQAIASYLGQLYQLIVIGFLLAIMASAMEDQATRLILIYLGYRRNSALQDFDAILRRALLAPQIGVLLRATLLLITVLPLGLAVSYKLFVGGSSRTVFVEGAGTFGYSAAPGNQRIGDGLTLLADIYQPFWINPALNKTYGYNLYIASNDTSAIPDTPYPGYLAGLQSKLNSGEYLIMTTTVNATVSQLANPTPKQRASSDWWNDVYDQFGHGWTQNGDNINGANNALWAGMGANIRSNFSIAFLSAWNTTLNQTFESEAYRCQHLRQLCTATWKITPTAATLTSVHLLPPTTPSTTAPSQSIIQDDWIGIQELFSNFLGEYDWHNRAGAFQYPYPSPISNTTSSPSFINPPSKWSLNINTVCPLSNAMVWARITSLNGGDRPNRDPDRVQNTMYTKPSSEISLIKFIPTLKRSALLLLVLSINPLIVFFCILLKTIMYRSPIDDGFNTIALLASTAGGEMGMLKGAGLSGELGRRINMRFDTVDIGEVSVDATGRRQIVGMLDHGGRSERLNKGVVYG